MSPSMNRVTAYRAEAAICRQKAESDAARRGFWLDEASRWEKRAENEREDAVAISYKINHGTPSPNRDR